MISRFTLLPILILAGFGLHAQVIPFAQKTTDAGRVGLTLSNVGTIGRPAVRSNASGPPSMSFPQKGLEHLFESGFWIGAIVNGQRLVSSSAWDASSGYSTGAQGFEFIQLAAPEEHSKKTTSPFYSSTAVSDQDFIFRMTDSATVVPGTSIPVGGGQHTPLGANAKLETYAWGSSYADFFVICNYTITNTSSNRWDSVWLGQWADLVVRNVNVTRDAGSAFFAKGRNSVDTKYKAIYAWLADNNADDANYISSFGAMQFLGIDWRGMFFNPDKPDTFVSRGFSPPRVNYNFWNFTTVDPNFAKPADEGQRYDRLATGIDSTTLYSSAGPVNGQPANWIQLLSAGPLPSVLPGESFNYVVAYVAARNSKKTIGSNNTVIVTPESLKELSDHLRRTRSTYIGENVNEDGKYRAELDLNSNGVLDRYIVPDAPATPRLKIIASDNKAEIYWDAASIESVDPVTRRKDFEGYRLYRSNPGDDLDQSIVNSRNLVGQWDSAGNNVGYNNGFDAIRLPQPVYFDGDPTPYAFKYTMDKLQNGWQYLFVVTAFDEGDEVLGIEPLESSFNENQLRVFAGATPKPLEEGKNTVGVYPNPYKTDAAWDGTSARDHKIYFFNLPARCTISIYTSSGDHLTTLSHDAATYKGQDSRWFQVYGNPERSVFSGGEHAWDLLSETKATITTGVYLFSVKDLDTGKEEIGKFAVIR
jgi:hypothetical protein